MSDVRPGEGWWQATDGRWYPPELLPDKHLVRDRTGATVLARPEPPRDAPQAATATSHELVGGAIDSHTELYLGRPDGLQNRPAAWLALAGATMVLVGAMVPWATRTIAVGGEAELGWRDAGGELGAGFYVALLAVTVMTVSVRCMAGSYSREWRMALVGLASATLVVAVVEAVRIFEAIDEVKNLTRGNVSLSPGPGLVLVVVGSLVVLTGAATYRVGSPH